MESKPVRAGGGPRLDRGSAPVAPAGEDRSGRPVRRPVAGRPVFVESNLDQPLGIIAVGPAGGSRAAVLAALLGTTAATLRVPRGSFLVINYAPEAGGLAYVPGFTEPTAYRAEPVGSGPALARPPRRVELAVPDPLLRHFAVVDTPDIATLGLAGARVVLDAVDQGGALLYVISAEQTPTAADLALLAEVARGDAAVFFVVTGTGDGSAGAGNRAGPDRSVVIEAQRSALLSALPELVDARWFALDPATTDTAYLRRALVDWAGPEGLRRASVSSPPLSGATRTIHLAAGIRDSGWQDHLDRRTRTVAHRLRQDLALELADIHLRSVQAVVFGDGCQALPEVLDRELHALSNQIMTECDLAVELILDETLTLVLGHAPDDGVRLRVGAALGWGLAEHRVARGLARVLLVTNAGVIESSTGPAAVATLSAYDAGPTGAILPAAGVALAGGCYQYWRNPANADRDKARSWLRRALREVELELSREVTHRIGAVRKSLATVLTDSVDQGILLA